MFSFSRKLFRSSVLGLVIATFALSPVRGATEGIDSLKMPQRQATDRPVTGAALAALLLQGVAGDWQAAASGNGGTIEFRADGSARVSWSTGQSEGRWRVKYGANCTTWDYQPDKESCNVYYRVGENTYETYHLADDVIDGGIVFHTVATGATALPLVIGLTEGVQIQEFVLITSSIDRTLPAYRQALKWKVWSEGAPDPALHGIWGLDPGVSAREVLVGNAQSTYGFVRLVELEGVAQQLIRPGGRWWDTGGMFNMNVLVKDLDATEALLRRLGWYANNLPESYQYPGNVRGKSVIMIGPDDVVLSFQQRTSPPLQGWPEFKGATHIEVGYQLVTDLEDWSAFHTDVLGLPLRGPIGTRGSDGPVGPNDFGLPHNASGLHSSQIASIKLREGGEQILGGRAFSNATGYDFSERAAPPNLGIAVIRIVVPDADGLAKRIKSKGVELQAEPRTMILAPYGRVRIFAVRTPGSSQTWLEFLQQL